MFCFGGRFCGGINLMELSGNCSVGYYCVFGVVLLNLYMINLI